MLCPRIADCFRTACRNAAFLCGASKEDGAVPFADVPQTHGGAFKFSQGKAAIFLYKRGKLC